AAGWTGSSAAEHSAKEIAKSTARSSRVRPGLHVTAGAATEHVLKPAALDRLVGEHAEQSHHPWRHAAAAAAAGRRGLALAARSVLHSVENVHQAHDCLLALHPWITGIRDDAVSDQSVPDEENDDRANGRGDESRALVGPVP